MNVNKLTAYVVKAGMNLEGTSNKEIASKMANQLKYAAKDSSFEKRVASYLASKQPLAFPESAVKTEKIIPENSINFVC